MFKKSFARIALLLPIAFMVGTAQAILMPTDTGPIDINSNNFANVIVDSSLSSTSLTFGAGTTFGPFTSAQAAPFILGSDLSLGLALGQGPVGGVADFVIPGFSLASIANGAGVDFAIWEAGTPSESFFLSVSTNGGASFSAAQLFSTTAVIPADFQSGFATNIGYVDLDLFGIAAGGLVDAVKVEGLFTGVGGSGPDLLAIAALNAGPPIGRTPEPSIIALLAVGLLGFGFARRRKHS